MGGVLNSIVDHLAVLDASGTIVAVNEAWKRFALENGAPDLAAHSVGLSYRASCTGAPGDSSASQTAEGLRAALAGVFERESVRHRVLPPAACTQRQERERARPPCRCARFPQPAPA